MGARIVICHWESGSSWTQIEVSTNALNGHSNHELDIWPPVAGVSEGQNWPAGQEVYLNGCVLAAEPSASASASASASPSASLPETGTGETIAMSILGVALLLLGAAMKARSLR